MRPSMAMIFGTGAIAPAVCFFDAAPMARADNVGVGVTLELAPGAPPAPRDETVPPPPSSHADRYVWVRGRWRWERGVWVWAPGHYVERPRGNAHWVEGHWDHRPNGWVWVEGGWR